MPPKVKDLSPLPLEFNGFSVWMPPDEHRDKVLTAIVKAILHSGVNKPSTPKEITNIIMANNYAHLGGQTPHATISSRISTHFKKCNESGGKRVPLLGRLLSEANNRRIKYYVDQLPFEAEDDDYGVIMRPDEPAKPTKRATSPSGVSVLPKSKSDSRRGSNESINAPQKKRKASSAGGVTSKQPKRKKTYSESESEPDHDYMDNQDETDDIAYDESHVIMKSVLDRSDLVGNTSSTIADKEIEGRELQEYHHSGSPNEQEDQMSLLSESEVDIDTEGEDHPMIPPQNPQQTYAFSPVFQPHIFIRPNTTSLPPLSTLHQQSALSHLSPPLVSASSPAIGPHSSVQSSRIFMPSPILLPSPRGMTVLSPQFGSGHALNNIHPLDLGPGIYSSPANAASGSINHNSLPGGSLPVQHPESISMGELDDLLTEHDESSGSLLAVKTKRKNSIGIADIGKRRASFVKKHDTSIGEKGHGASSSRPRSHQAGSLEKIVPPIPKSPPVFRTRPSLAPLQPPIPRNSQSAAQLFEIGSIHLNIPCTIQQQFSSSSGQIVTVSRFKSCPVISMALHTIIVAPEKSFQSPTASFNLNMQNYIRIGDLVSSYSHPSLYEDSLGEMDASFLPLWNRFCKNLLHLSVSKDPVRPSSPNCDEIDAALSLMGLVKPESGVFHGGTSFSVQIVPGDKKGYKSLFSCDLIVVALKAGTTGITRECNGIWIPLEISKYLTSILKVPYKVNDLYPVIEAARSSSASARIRSFSVSSVSSGTSSRNQQATSLGDSTEEGYLKFDESDDEIDVGKDDGLTLTSTTSFSAESPGQFLPATTIDPSILTLIPASNLAESLMWMTTIDGVFVYITWISDRVLDNTARSLTPGGSDYNANQLPTGIGIPILRRVDNGMVNASQLLHAGGLVTEQEKSVILSLERFKKRYRRSDSALRGTWIPLSRARELSRTLSLDQRLQVFLSDDAGQVSFGVMSPMKRKKPSGAQNGGSGRKTAKPYSLGGGLSQNRVGGNGAVSSLFPGGKSSTSAFSPPSAHPRTNIYPPGSLAAIKFAKAQAAAAQLAQESQQSPAGSPTSSAVKSPNLGPKSKDVKAEPGELPASVPSEPGHMKLSRSEVIAATESATRTAISALANTLAQSTRVNPSLTPAVIAATLAAFASGAKKIIDEVRSNAKSSAPTPAAILQAFANSVKQTGSPTGLIKSVADGQFPSITLAERSVDILAQLGASIETTAKNTNDPSSDVVTDPHPKTLESDVPVSSAQESTKASLPSLGEHKDAVVVAAPVFAADAEKISDTTHFTTPDDAATVAPANDFEDLVISELDDSEIASMMEDMDERSLSPMNSDIGSPRPSGGKVKREGGKSLALAIAGYPGGLGKSWGGGGGKSLDRTWKGGAGKSGVKSLALLQNGGKSPLPVDDVNESRTGKSVYFGGKSVVSHNGGKVLHGGKSGGGKSSSLFQHSSYAVDENDDSDMSQEDDNERSTAKDLEEDDPEEYEDPYRHTMAAKSLRAANAHGGKVRRTVMPPPPSPPFPITQPPQSTVTVKKAPVAKPKIRNASSAGTKKTTKVDTKPVPPKPVSKPPPPPPRLLPPESVRVQSTDEDEDIDILN